MSFLGILSYTLRQYAKYHNVLIDANSSVTFRHMRSDFKKFCGTKEYPIIIKNSTVQAVSACEGCKIFDSVLTDNIEMQKFVTINGCRLFARTGKIKIGSFTSIGPNTVIQEAFHRKKGISTYHMWQNVFLGDVMQDIESKGDIEVEEDVWVGANSVILSGVKIGRGSIIGAGSIVTKNIPSYSIAAGNPANVIKTRFSPKVIQALEELKWWQLSTDQLNKTKEAFSLDLTKDEDIERLLLLFRTLEKNYDGGR